VSEKVPPKAVNSTSGESQPSIPTESAAQVKQNQQQGRPFCSLTGVTECSIIENLEFGIGNSNVKGK
jgi:hypothetical protein